MDFILYFSPKNPENLAGVIRTCPLKPMSTDLLEAEGAEEVLRVELAEHGRDAAAGDGLVAAGAERAPHGVVVRLAVGQTVVLEEVATHEGLL